MTFAANIYLNYIAGNSTTGNEFLATSTFYSNFVIVRMYIGLHIFHLAKFLLMLNYYITI